MKLDLPQAPVYDINIILYNLINVKGNRYVSLKNHLYINLKISEDNQPRYFHICYLTSLVINKIALH